MFRNVIEAVTYALFPLFVLLLLLTSGRETMLAFKGYAAILIWDDPSCGRRSTRS